MVARRAAAAPRAESVALSRRRFTIDEYDRMVDAGILHEDECVELLAGEIVRMSPIGTRHQACTDRANRWFSRRLPDTALVRVQGSFRLNAGSEPQPDLGVLRYREDYYAASLPGPDDILLLIEVSDTSLRYDRQVKLPLYAAAGIPEVWIADLDGERTFVCCAPRRGKYTRQSIVERGGTLTPLAFPDLALALDDVLGPRP